MGVTGLTTYMDNNSLAYFDRISIKNSPLVIDGNSLAAHVVIRISSKMTFGGDYDMIGWKIEEIFKSFASCGIVPIVIFDGAVEKKRYKTILRRVRHRVTSYEKLNPGSSCNCFFPLLFRMAIREKLLSLGVTILQSDMEADREIAAVAKKLNAPVLSNDSDYFIYDVPYIPIDKFTFRKVNGGIPCEIFYPEKFLRICHLNKEVLPLLSFLAGNDYTECFPDFIRTFKQKQNMDNLPKAQKNILSILNFLKSETYKSGVNKILCAFNRPEKKKGMEKIITKIVESYTNFDTTLTNYIPENILKRLNSTKKYGEPLVTAGISNLKISQETVCADSEEDVSSEESEYASDEEIDAEDEEEIIFRQSVPNWVFHQSRIGNFHPDMLTLIHLKEFFGDPQIEDYSLPGSCIVSAPLINTIAGILLKEKEFIFWNRDNSNKYECSTVKIIDQSKQFKLESLNELELSQKRNFFLKLYGVDNTFLEAFPEEWLLYLFSLIFWAKAPNSSASENHFHCLLLMLVAVESMERMIGRYWSNFFMKITYHKNKIESLKPEDKKNKDTKISVKEAIQKLNKNQCYLMVEPLSPYFKNDKSNKNIDGSKLIVHSFSEFQNCLLATIMLNQVFGMPFEPPKLSKLYNSTFLYNMAVKLKSVKSVSDYVAYISNFFNSQGSVTLTNLYLSLVRTSEAYLSQKTVKAQKPKQKRNRRKKAPAPTVTK